MALGPRDLHDPTAQEQAEVKRLEGVIDAKMREAELGDDVRVYIGGPMRARVYAQIQKIYRAAGWRNVEKGEYDDQRDGASYWIEFKA